MEQVESVLDQWIEAVSKPSFRFKVKAGEKV